MYSKRRMAGWNASSLQATTARPLNAVWRTKLKAAKRLPLLLLPAAVFSFHALRLLGQATDGNLVGTVRDDSGAAVPEAQVKITNRTTNLETTTRSNGSGDYRFNNIPVGSYDLSVSAPGFRAITERNVAVELNKTATVNVSLQAGPVTQTVAGPAPSATSA